MASVEAEVKAEAASAPPKVFWSWQSDYSPATCRHFIREALVSAIKLLTDELGVDDADRPEIDHDTKGERGMADISATILNKIGNSAVFVADLTPIARSAAGKWLPNPNVMIELGWAMHRPGWERVIGVLNTASGAEVEDLPFDIRQRRIITFVLNEGAEKATRKAVQTKLTRELKEALRINLENRSEELAAATAVSGVAAKQDDPSIWASAADVLRHNDAFGRGRPQEVRIPQVGRSYMRVIPAGWKQRLPSIADIAHLGQALTVDAPSDSARDGDFGATAEGFVRYWITGPHGESPASSTNITMYFEDTGEFWMLHGSVIVDHRGHRLLRDHMMLGQWSSTLRRALKVMDKFGARETRRIEAGLFGVTDIKWFAEWEGDRPYSRRNAVLEVRQSRDWDDAAQLTFLTDTYNRVKNLFALERSTEAEVARILIQFDRERFVPHG